MLVGRLRFGAHAKQLQNARTTDGSFRPGIRPRVGSSGEEFLGKRRKFWRQLRKFQHGGGTGSGIRMRLELLLGAGETLSRVKGLITKDQHGIAERQRPGVTRVCQGAQNASDQV